MLKSVLENSDLICCLQAKDATSRQWSNLTHRKGKKRTKNEENGEAGIAGASSESESALLVPPPQLWLEPGGGPCFYVVSNAPPATSVRVVVRVLLVGVVLNLPPSPSSPLQDFVAAAGDLVHPDGVQDVQGDARRDPGHLRPQAQPLERRRAEIGRAHV